MKVFAVVVVIVTLCSQAFAAGEKRQTNPKTCTYDMCFASALKHGHKPSAAAGWCQRHLATGDACKNVGK